MKWFSSWWGIQITAENDEGEAVLRQLLKRLPPKAEKSYDDGDIEVGNETSTLFANHTGFTITFNR